MCIEFRAFSKIEARNILRLYIIDLNLGKHKYQLFEDGS